MSPVPFKERYSSHTRNSRTGNMRSSFPGQHYNTLPTDTRLRWCVCIALSLLCYYLCDGDGLNVENYVALGGCVWSVLLGNSCQQWILHCNPLRWRWKRAIMYVVTSTVCLSFNRPVLNTNTHWNWKTQLGCTHVPACVPLKLGPRRRVKDRHTEIVWFFKKK